MSRRVTARCHCGAVKLEATLKSDRFEPSRCTCSFCRRRQAGNVSAAVNQVKILRGNEVLTLYEFGTGTAKHFFCSVCGIYTHHQRRADTSEIGINLGCIDGALPWEHEPIPWTDGIRHPSDEK